MKRILLITFTILALSLGLSSCSKDKDDTKATILLIDANQAPVNGITVYAYTSGTWNSFGDDSFFADKTISSDANGEAIFLLDDIVALFAFDSQETIYFSAHYEINGVEKQESTSLTFKEGDSKTATLILD